MSTFKIKNTNIELHSGLYINGEWVQGTGQALESINPATEDLIATVDTASNADVDKAVAAARDTFEHRWGNNISSTTRSNLLYECMQSPPHPI